MPDEYYEVDPQDVRPPLIASTERVAASERTMTNVDASLKDLRKLIEEGYAIAEQLHECIPVRLWSTATRCITKNVANNYILGHELSSNDGQITGSARF
jgi:hypothetical protein